MTKAFQFTLVSLALLLGGAPATGRVEAGDAADRPAARFVAPPGASLATTHASPGVLDAAGVAKECKRTGMTGTLLEGGRALELAPLYSECEAKALGGLPAKMVWWDCGYVLHPVAAARLGGDTWRARVQLRCPPSHDFEWNVYESQTKYDEGSPMCVTRMPPQSVGGVAELRNVSGDHGAVAVVLRLRGIRYEATGSAFFCGSAPGASKHDASYASRIVVGATDSSGRPIDFALGG